MKKKRFNQSFCLFYVKLENLQVALHLVESERYQKDYSTWTITQTNTPMPWNNTVSPIILSVPFMLVFMLLCACFTVPRVVSFTCTRIETSLY